MWRRKSSKDFDTPEAQSMRVEAEFFNFLSGNSQKPNVSVTFGDLCHK